MRLTDSLEEQALLEAVLEESGASSWGVLDHLASLVDKSLVTAETSGESEIGRASCRERVYVLV